MELDELLTELGLEGWCPVDGGVRGGTEEDHLVAVLSRDGTSIVLKERAAYLSDEEFDCVVSNNRALARAGAPVPPVPEALARLVARRAPAGRRFSTVLWVGGRPLDPDAREDLECLGRALARFHRAARQIDATEPRVRSEPRERFGKARHHRRLLESRLGPELTDELYERLVAAQRLVAGYPAGAMPSQLLHGDVDPHNAVRTESGCVLLDVDDMHSGPVISDLAWLAILTAGMRRTADEAGYTFRDEWDGERCDAVLGAYRSEARLERTPPGLRPWLVASVVCAMTDCFHHNRWLVDERRLRDEAMRALHLADAAPETAR
jgi:Ser/Thr protein kinase RdoA (MazF antagonist)